MGQALDSLDPNASELDKFLAVNGIDAAASNALRYERPEIQQTVIAMGNFTTSTNPSASLMARIKNAKNPDFRSGKGGFKGQMQSGGNFGFPGTNPQLALPSPAPPGLQGTMPQMAPPQMAPPQMAPPGYPGTTPQFDTSSSGNG